MPTCASRIRSWAFASLSTVALAAGGFAQADDATSGFQPANLSSSFDNGNDARIPCEFYLGGILIPIPTPDKKQAFLLFDTGANEPILTAAFAKKIRIRGTGAFPVTGIGAEAPNGSLSTDISFSLPGITFRRAHWAIIADLPFDEEYGRPVVGVLGMDLLKDFVIRIDYVGHTIDLIAPGKFKPPEGFACLPLEFDKGSPTVAATVHSEAGSAMGEFLLDTGENGALELGRLFIDAKEGLKFTPFAESGTSGIGGAMLNEEAVCPALDLGSLTVKQPLVDLDQSIQGISATIDGLIGNEIWHRFDVVLDLPDRKLYLRSNAHFSDPFDYVSAGMHLLALGNNYDTITVREIRAGSPGDQAGFRSDDVIVGLNELGKAPLTIANVYPLVHRPGTYHFTVRRGDQTLSLTLELKNPAGL